MCGQKKLKKQTKTNKWPNNKKETKTNMWPNNNKRDKDQHVTKQ